MIKERRHVYFSHTLKTWHELRRIKENFFKVLKLFSFQMINDVHGVAIHPIFLKYVGYTEGFVIGRQIPERHSGVIVRRGREVKRSAWERHS